MKNFVLKVALFCAVAMIASCQRSEDVVPSVQKTIAQGITLENGRIVFSTVEDFKSLIHTLKAMKDPERKAWDSRFGHQSLQHFYDIHEGLVTSETNPTYRTQAGDKPYVPDVLFAHILNENGLYQIGNEVHQITAGAELVVDKSLEGLLTTNVNDSQIKRHTTTVRVRQIQATVKLASSQVISPNNTNSDLASRVTNRSSCVTNVRKAS